MAYCTRCSGRASMFAPASIKTKTFVSVGSTAAMPGRSIPGSVRSLIALAATAAPVCPALTIASALSCFTRSTARLTDESFFRRTASTAPIAHLHDLTSRGRSRCGRRCSRASSVRPQSSVVVADEKEFRDVRILLQRHDCTATRLGGPKSPPMASSAIFIGCGSLRTYGRMQN